MQNTDITVIYKSSGDCTLMFTSKPIIQGVMYPTDVLYECEICDKHHFFHAVMSFVPSTPSKKKLFEEYCTRNFITVRDIEVV